MDTASDPDLSQLRADDEEFDLYGDLQEESAVTNRKRPRTDSIADVPTYTPAAPMVTSAALANEQKSDNSSPLKRSNAMGTRELERFCADQTWKEIQKWEDKEHQYREAERALCPRDAPPGTFQLRQTVYDLHIQTARAKIESYRASLYRSSDLSDRAVARAGQQRNTAIGDCQELERFLHAICQELNEMQTELAATH